MNAKFNGAILDDQFLYLGGAGKHFEKIADLPFMIRQYASPDVHNGHLSFRGARLRNTKIFGNLKGVDFRRADLRGADLSQATNAAAAHFRGAIYDSRTLWPVDPKEVGAVVGPDIRMSFTWYFGSWVIDTEREDGGSGPAGELKLRSDKTFVWNPGGGAELIKGSWSLIEGFGGNATTVAVRLANGELGVEWIAVIKRWDEIELRSADGKRFRRCYRT
jgi:hypothetical protein